MIQRQTKIKLAIQFIMSLVIGKTCQGHTSHTSLLRKFIIYGCESLDPAVSEGQNLPERSNSLYTKINLQNKSSM